MSDIHNHTVQGLKAGDTFTVTRQFTKEDVINFAEITRDYNPVHFDNRLSDAKNFKDRICHGLLVGSMLTEVGGQIGWLATGMDFSFEQPIDRAATRLLSRDVWRGGERSHGQRRIPDGF